MPVLSSRASRPNTTDLGLENAKVECDECGDVKGDDRLETSAPGICALGECNGDGAFTYVAYDNYEIVSANLLDADARRTSGRIPCYALFIDPPLDRTPRSAALRHRHRSMLQRSRRWP